MESDKKKREREREREKRKQLVSVLRVPFLSRDKRIYRQIQ